MTTSSLDSDDRARRLGQVIAAYLDALDVGRAPDRRTLLGQHPDLAAYFAEHDRFQRVVALLEPSGDDAGKPDPDFSRPRGAKNRHASTIGGPLPRSSALRVFILYPGRTAWPIRHPPLRVEGWGLPDR